MIGLDTFGLRGGIVNTLLYHMSLDMDEHHIYGSSRLGISSHLGTITEMEFDATVTVQGNFDNVDVQSVTNNTFQNAFIAANTSITGGGTIPTKFMKEDIGLKIYEYTNHLGNVLLTTNDKRLRIDNNSDNLIDSYLAVDLSKSDYYPYGMAMVGRNTNLSDYRFGYQGSEMDNEFDGSAGSHYTTYFRQLDPRLGRWMSIDPVTQPRQSPYTSMDNNPIGLNDVMGDKTYTSAGGTTKSFAGGAVSKFTNNQGHSSLTIGGTTISLPRGMSGGKGKLGGTLAKLSRLSLPPGLKDGGKESTDMVWGAIASEFTGNDVDKAKKMLDASEGRFSRQSEKTAYFGGGSRSERNIERKRNRFTQDQKDMLNQIALIFKDEMVTEITIIFQDNYQESLSTGGSKNHDRITNNSNADLIGQRPLEELVGSKKSGSLQNGMGSWGFFGHTPLGSGVGNQNVMGLLVIQVNLPSSVLNRSGGPNPQNLNRAILNGLNEYSIKTYGRR